MKPILFHVLLSLAYLSVVPQMHARADTTFAVESDAFTDNRVMDHKCAGKNPANANCTGDNVSPPLHWSDAPAGTNNLVLIISNPQSTSNLGVNHWMTYGVPATQISLPEGAGTGPALRMGQNFIDKPTYLGPCPLKGTSMCHYVFLLTATGLALNTLPNRLTRTELGAAIRGHSKDAAAWIGRFGNF